MLALNLRGHCRHLSPGLALLAFTFAGLSVKAQEGDGRPASEWQITPRISVGTTYSDNIRLAPSDQAEGDLVLQVDPGVSVRKQGGRLDLRFDYTAQGQLYTQQGETKLNNKLLGSGTAELYQDHLFLDVQGSISQVPNTTGGRVDAGNLGLGGGSGSSFATGLFNNLNLGLPGSADLFNPVGLFSDIALTGDQTTASSFSLSPYWRQNFGGWTEALLRYRYSTTGFNQDSGSNGQPGASDGDIQRVEINLKSGQRFSALNWSLDYSRQQQALQGSSSDNPQQESSDSTEESVKGRVGYRLSRRWALLAEAGYENNDVATFQNDNRNGSYWGLGAIWDPNRFFSLTGLYGPDVNEIAARWTPSPRLNFEISRRDQTVGVSPGVHWNGSMDYRSRYGRWSTKYTEEVTSTQQLLSNPVTLDDQGQIIVVDSPFGLTDQQFLQKRFETEYTYQRGRNGWTLKAFSEDRQGEDDAASETAYGLGGLWTWRFAPRTASFLGTGWERDELSDDQQNDYWVSVIGLARVFSPDTGGLISYRYYRNDAEPADQGFQENRLNVRFSMKF
ncbi:MAG: hypothetical protein KDJ28_03875 [Candidatus Competibacteraceae bacterium]|nr:hypothetical protein [Candidatus Competibacteraceae bacterium]